MAIFLLVVCLCLYLGGVLTGPDPVNQFGVWKGMVALGVVGSALGMYWFANLLFRDQLPVRAGAGKRFQQLQGLRDQVEMGVGFRPTGNDLPASA